jgi:hypothetical protein
MPRHRARSKPPAGFSVALSRMIARSSHAEAILPLRAAIGGIDVTPFGQELVVAYHLSSLQEPSEIAEIDAISLFTRILDVRSFFLEILAQPFPALTTTGPASRIPI